jgi:prefoldin subunit 5
MLKCTSGVRIEEKLRQIEAQIKQLLFLIELLQRSLDDVPSRSDLAETVFSMGDCDNYDSD